jgi:hypothetical protein
LYIAPGSPWENGYSESFNSRMKAEFADREVFGSLLEAKVLGAEYKRYWNQERLHSGIEYKTPAEFAADLGPDSASLRPPQDRSQHQPTLIIRSGRGADRADRRFLQRCADPRPVPEIASARALPDEARRAGEQLILFHSSASAVRVWHMLGTRKRKESVRR